MFNYANILHYIAGEDKSSKNLLKIYLKYKFPGSAELATILKKAQPSHKLPAINIESEPEESIINIINTCLMDLHYDKSIIREFNKNTSNPKLWVLDLPFMLSVRNLNYEASNGNIDPIIGRNKEIDEVIQVISNRRKRNPVLIGDAGVGKTAIVEGLATRINNKEVPITMFDKTILEINISEFVEFSDGMGRFKALMEYVSDSNGSIILFIDEIHTIANARRESGLILMDIMKPYLARGDVSIIAATTEDEFRKIEKDKAMARRLQAILVEETTEEQTVEILKGVKEVYMREHNIDFNIDIENTIVRASRNLSGYNPDKSITLLDNVLAKLKIDNEGIKGTADINRVIEILGSRYNIRKEFLISSNVIDAYTETFKKKLPIYSDQAKNILETIIDAHHNNTKNSVASFTLVSGIRSAGNKLSIALAETLTNDNNYLYLNGYEFTTDVAITRIKGAPPAYVGYGDQCIFSKVKHKAMPIIIDSFEVMHPAVQEAILDIIRLGTMETTSNETIPFKNCDFIFILGQSGISGTVAESELTFDNTLEQLANLAIATRVFPIKDYMPILKKYKKDPDEYNAMIQSGITPKELEEYISQERVGLKIIK